MRWMLESNACVMGTERGRKVEGRQLESGFSRGVDQECENLRCIEVGLGWEQQVWYGLRCGVVNEAADVRVKERRKYYLPLRKPPFTELSHAIPIGNTRVQ